MSFIPIEAKSQSGVGCFRVSDVCLYSQKNIFGYYELLGNRYTTTPNACPRSQSVTTTGIKCQFALGGTLHDVYNYILYTAMGLVQCDLDQYVYGVLTIGGFLAFRKITRI
ncbi:hypothetical protein [Pedobacter agri]|uniref:hypothetical protein n=1 Tax=Pedobacter agri TaxID=454586 RepID=UPI00292D8260|nr:hypothetical protein [Pedobacter agri]